MVLWLEIETWVIGKDGTKKEAKRRIEWGKRNGGC
jgi:hypothetical protein